MKQSLDRQTKVKSRVSNTAVLAGIAIAAAIGLSLVTASLITPKGIGNFYAGSGDIPLPPPKPVCPVGGYAENGKYVYICEDDGTAARHTCDKKLEDANGVELYRCLDSNGNTDNNQVCCLEKAPACPVGYSVCGKDTSAVCCGANETCESKKWPPLVGDTIYFCKPKTCPDPARPKLCSGSTNNTCCASTDSCGVSGIGIAYCKPAGCTNPNCGDICCTDNEVCVTKTGTPPVCQPKDPSSCDSDGADNIPGNSDDQEYCQGRGEYAERKRCCPIHTCYVMPNGYPQCK